MDLTKKRIDILSFDGGGSRGVMELKILDDVLRLATIVLKTPETVKYLVKEENDEKEENFLEDRAVRERLINDLRDVKDPIHPAEVYEMIVGTSTGALIAFGLVGGNKVGNNHRKRERMTVEECIQMYLTKTREIFRKTWSHWFYSYIPLLSKIPLLTYSQGNVEKALEDQFGDCILSDLGGVGPLKNVAGAVARKLGEKGDLVLFDTASEDYNNYKAYEVLLASSNAPIYFNTPVDIGNDKFVDGGVGGNCPLKQAIPRAQKHFGKDGKDVKIVSVLSIAPPLHLESAIDSNTGFESWVNYFVKESTDGNAVYNDVVKQHRWNKTLFQRLSPRGESLKKFKLDEIDVQKMLDYMKKEKAEDDMFLVDVVATAMVVVFTSVKKVKNEQKTTLTTAARLAKVAGLAYESRKEYESAIVSYETSKRLQKKVGIDFTYFEVSYKIAKCMKKQGRFQLAMKSFKSNVNILVGHQGDKKIDDILVDTLIEIADCYLATFRYADAEEYLEEFRLKYKKKEDINDEKFARVFTKEAWCKQQQGKFVKAVNLYTEAATYTPDDDNPEKAEIQNNIGLCFVSLGMKEKGLEFVRKAQKIREKLNTPNKDSLVAESLYNVGFCLLKKGDFDKAKDSLERAKEKYDQLNDEIGISLALRNLAAYLSLKHEPEYDRALAYAQQALEKIKNSVPYYYNPGIARSLSVLGLCLFKAGKFKEAKKKLLQASDITKYLFSEDHWWLIDIYKLLYNLYMKDDEQEAKEYETKRIKIESEIENMAKNIEENIEIRWKPLPDNPSSKNNGKSEN
ncbi:uncharacterized protein LOC124434790 [Xenia sp. Carnegie-2017]|uniref:uncharacterized protein LOC124434790 n=1 Tax=Xenia sp. Carnegie-2017 TaxID=2897299 RepID=UPI001F03FF75|nr:uncharacterized protein LOC124434790 [Xenia sp. Carnegie-2017]XP_046840656.1 uncharacterized protein LOC124434790 [Xenia sp. Carnegie-2017]